MKASFHTSTRVVRLALLAGLWAAACSPSSNNATGTGGAVTTGGSTETGGTTGSGGTASSGGASSSGGAPGGATATGGSVSGGASGTGGSLANGGDRNGGSTTNSATSTSTSATTSKFPSLTACQTDADCSKGSCTECETGLCKFVVKPPPGTELHLGDGRCWQLKSCTTSADCVATGTTFAISAQCDSSFGAGFCQPRETAGP
jgi:hypothetical protein